MSSPAAATPARVVGYYYGPIVRRGFPVSKVRGNLLTHINYAFAAILPDGSAALGNAAVDTSNFRELIALKAQYPHLRILIAFGGWGGSKYFSEAAASAENRARFIQTTLDVFLRAYPGLFDGVDLDWEYPVQGGLADNVRRPEDRENLTALVRALRVALDAEAGPGGKHYLITIAAPAGPGHLSKYEMDKLGAELDFINVMTYDFHSGTRIAHFNAPLRSASDDPTPEYNTVSSVEAYLKAGVPREKLVVGVPFYGYGYANVPAEHNGRMQPITPPDTSAGKPKWTGAIRFYDIARIRADGFEEYWDKTARVPWLYNAATQTWVTYDDARSLGEKAKYAREARLGGIMIWELSGDDGTLLPAINMHLGRKAGP